MVSALANLVQEYIFKKESFIYVSNIFSNICMFCCFTPSVLFRLIVSHHSFLCSAFLLLSLLFLLFFLSLLIFITFFPLFFFYLLLLCIHHSLWTLSLPHLLTFCFSLTLYFAHSRALICTLCVLWISGRCGSAGTQGCSGCSFRLTSYKHNQQRREGNTQGTVMPAQGGALPGWEGCIMGEKRVL